MKQKIKFQCHIICSILQHIILQDIKTFYKINMIKAIHNAHEIQKNISSHIVILKITSLSPSVI